MMRLKHVICLLTVVPISAWTDAKAHASSAGHTVRLEIYGAASERPLSFDEFVAISCPCGNNERNTACLLDADTFDCLSFEPLFEDGQWISFHFEQKCVLTVVWRTEHTGYSTLFLDNEGEGWTEDATVVFNYQAAKDYWRKLQDGLAKRPCYRPSAEFKQLKHEAKKQLDLARQATCHEEKAKCGQRALDLILQAFEILLRDYGIQQSRHREGDAPYWGFTVDQIEGHSSHFESIRKLTEQRPDRAWVRIVCDLENDADTYREMVRSANDKGLKVLLQILDSSENHHVSLADFKNRVKDYVNTFQDCVAAYEIGNEVNMEGYPDMICKMEFAADYIRSQPELRDVKIAVVLFWQMGTGCEAGNGAYTLFHWVNRHVRDSEKLLKHVDLWYLSVYHDGYPMGGCFDEVMTRLQSTFPKCSRIGFGEFDYWIPDVKNAAGEVVGEGTDRIWWWRRKECPEGLTRQEFLEWHYAALAGYDRSVLGGFWWEYVREMHPGPKNPLWNTAHRLFNDMNRR